MKKFILGFILGAMIFGFTAIYAEESLHIFQNPFPIIVNGSKQDIPAYNIDGFTYMKLADIGKILGVKVIFNETDKQIEITKKESEKVVTEDTIPIISNIPPVPGQEKNNQNPLVLSEPPKDYYVKSSLVQDDSTPQQLMNTIVQFDQSDEGLKIVQYNDAKWVEVTSIRNKIKKYYTDGSYNLATIGGFDKPQIKILYHNMSHTVFETPLNVYGTHIAGSTTRNFLYITYDDYKNIILPEIKIRNFEE